MADQEWSLWPLTQPGLRQFKPAHTVYQVVHRDDGEGRMVDNPFRASSFAERITHAHHFSEGRVRCTNHLLVNLEVVEAFGLRESIMHPVPDMIDHAISNEFVGDEEMVLTQPLRKGLRLLFLADYARNQFLIAAQTWGLDFEVILQRRIYCSRDEAIDLLDGRGKNVRNQLNALEAELNVGELDNQGAAERAHRDYEALNRLIEFERTHVPITPYIKAVANRQQATA